MRKKEKSRKKGKSTAQVRVVGRKRGLAAGIHRPWNSVSERIEIAADVFWNSDSGSENNNNAL